MGAHRGKILDVNLSTGNVKAITIEEDVLRKFIGGSGLAAKLFLDRVSPDVEPLSDKNVLFLMAGPLSGTNFPTSSRIVAAFKSPQTGIWGQASAGGSFAAEMKKAGYDGIAVSGASSRPVYLVIEDGRRAARIVAGPQSPRGADKGLGRQQLTVESQQDTNDL